MSGERIQRDFGLDLVRAGAAVLVLAVHFFLNTDFYNVNMTGKTMAFAAVARMMCMTCVPLFLMLTGYLCVQRTWSKGYYRKLLPVLLTYLVAGALCLSFEGIWLGKETTLEIVLIRYLDFNASSYAWYIEMYIGLFLLSPFLNAAWTALKQNARLALVCTMLFLTALPAVTNIWEQILPDWWTGIYPITYYLLGAWLREHPIRIRAPWLLAGWVALAAAVGLLRYRMIEGGLFVWAEVSDWGSLFVVGETVCLFTLLRRAKGIRWPRPLRWCVHRVARVSLALYLVSSISDQILYPYLRQAVPFIPHRMFFLPLMVLVSLVCSGVMGQLVDWMVRALLRLLPRKGGEGRP